MAQEDIPFDEITLRSYGAISNRSGRDLIKLCCLSMGLLNPQDKRDVIIDVVHVLVLAGKNKEWLSSSEVNKRVISHRKELNLSLEGTAGSNIRRVLKSLKDFGLIESQRATYRIIDFDSLDNVFLNNIAPKIRHMEKRVISYLKQV